jgi:hypothetical protein
MKRFTLVLVAVLALVAAPALFAQNPLNTTAPGATQEQRPGQTNNDLPNPGNPQTQQAVPNQQNGTYQEHGTVEGTATESTTGTNDLNNQTGTSTGTTGTTGTTGSTTGTTTGTMGTTGTMNNTDSTGTTTGTTGTTGTMNNDTTGSGTTGSSGSYSGSTGSGSMNNTDTTTGSTGSYSGSATDTTSTTTSGSLPQTASDLPTVAIAGLLALFAAFAIRTYAKRNA